MLRPLAATLFVLFSACAEDEQSTYQRPVRGPDGRRGWMIQCKERSECYEKAAKLCKYGYTLVDSGSQITGATVGPFRSIDVDSETSIFIECKD